MATYNGDYNNNVYNGTSKKDEIAGFDGDDQLAGGAGDDYIYGGTNQGVSTEAYGGNDYLNGGSDNDHLYGGGQNDLLEGGSGDDTLSGDAGNDTLHGGTGKDLFVFAAHTSTETDEVLDFSVKDDKLDLSSFGIGSFDTVRTLFGGDTGYATTAGAVLSITSNYITQTLVLDNIDWSTLTASNVHLNTSDAKDALSGTAAVDFLFGGGGNDHLSGLNNNDVLFGEQDNDTIYGGDATGTNLYDGNDQLYGGDGNDELHGGSQNDYLDGGIGNDELYAGSGADTLHGGLGKDTFIFGTLKTQNSTIIQDFDTSSDKIDLHELGISDMSELRDVMTSTSGGTQIATAVGGYALVATLEGVDKSSLTASMFIFDTDKHALISGGTAYADNLFGSVGKDTMSGSDGDDHLWGGAGDDKLYGGAQSGTDAEQYGGNDVLKGGDGNDKLYGGGYSDVLVGGTGNDTLDGGLGADTLTGGAGKDVFLYTGPAQSVGNVSNANYFYNADVISDFTQGDDKIDLSQIDARAGGADDPFKWDGKTSGTTTPGEGHLAFNYVEGYTHVFGSVDGSSVSIDIYLKGHIDLTKADFVL